MRPIIGGNLLKRRVREAAPYRRRKPPDRAAAWGRPYSFSGVNLSPGRAGEDTRPYGETRSGSFFFVGAGHRPARRLTDRFPRYGGRGKPLPYSDICTGTVG